MCQHRVKTEGNIKYVKCHLVAKLAATVAGRRYKLPPITYIVLHLSFLSNESLRYLLCVFYNDSELGCIKFIEATFSLMPLPVFADRHTATHQSTINLLQAHVYAYFLFSCQNAIFFLQYTILQVATYRCVSFSAEKTSTPALSAPASSCGPTCGPLVLAN